MNYVDTLELRDRTEPAWQEALHAAMQLPADEYVQCGESLWEPLRKWIANDLVWLAGALEQPQMHGLAITFTDSRRQWTAARPSQRCRETLDRLHHYGILQAAKLHSEVAGATA
jgi:hypothetical protein